MYILSSRQVYFNKIHLISAISCTNITTKRLYYSTGGASMLNAPGKLNRSVPIPLYFQLKELILNEIKSGRYKRDDLIPTEKELSEMFDLSRTTVRQALTELVQEGWLYRVKSKGTFVSYPKIPQNYISTIESFNNQIQRLGMHPSTEQLEMSVLSASQADPAIAAALRLQQDSRLIYLFRNRFADNEPFVTVKTYLPYDHCSFVLDHDFNTETLYSVLSQTDRTDIFRIERTIEARSANTEDVKLLKIRRDTPIQHFISIGYNSYGEPIEYTISRYRGDLAKFEVTVFPEDKEIAPGIHTH